MKILISAIISLIFFSISAFSAESTYTSVKVEDCITLNSSEFDEPFEIDYYEGICQGQGPYVVKISGGDLRYSLSVLYRGQEINGLTKTIAFHDMGSEVVEWRYATNANDAKELKALIFRVSSYELDTNVNLLHVVKLDKMNTCTVSVLRDEEQDNVKARNIADNIESYSCL